MKDFIIRQGNIIRIEFWAFTTIFAFILFFFLTEGLGGNTDSQEMPFSSRFEEANVPFSFYSNYFIPQLIRNITLFMSFMTLNFLIIPKLFKGKKLMLNLGLLLLIVITSAFIFGITDSFLRAYLYSSGNRDEINEHIISESIDFTISFLALLSIYSAIKYGGLYLLFNLDAIHSRYRYITKEGIIAMTVWLVILLIFLSGNARRQILYTWMLLIPYAILFYSYAIYKLIPKCLQNKQPFFSYVLRSIVIIAIFFFPIMILILVSIQNENLAFNLIFLNTVFQLFITVPATWVLYKRKIKGNEEMYVLKKELKQTTANIDFLRSQINPHFLFNALNTIYGTAIQEKAERTSEGIEKLGDMMRFMLQENMQEKISLSREIDYLNNYISLQRLRTDTNPIVQIQTEITQGANFLHIAPMLLIPFVENAFKHGISFREPSQIKITLEIKDNTVYFDVYNIKHPRQDSDPEKDKSGIGLENVKQRLKLLYPNKHELIIRETPKEFFIHLTIQLA